MVRVVQYSSQRRIRRAIATEAQIRRTKLTPQPRPCPIDILCDRVTTKEHLVLAIARGDTMHVQWCVERQKLHKKREFATPLVVAARLGHDNVVRTLLKAGALAGAVTVKGISAIHAASCAGFDKVVRTLIEFGARVDAQEERGFTALHYSIIHNHRAVFEYLLCKAHANPSITSADGCNALHLAAEGDSDNGVFFTRLLIQAGAPLNILGGPCGWTALQMACYKSHGEVAEILVHAGADTRILSRDGHSALHIAAQTGCIQALSAILSHTDVNMRNVRGEHALHFAVASGKDDALRLFLQHPALDLNARQADGCTALVFAAVYGRHDAIRLLLADSRTNVNLPDDTGRTALMRACMRDDADAVHILLPLSNARLRTVRGSSCMHFIGDPQIARLLLSAGADPHCINDEGLRPVHVAALRGRTSMLRWLVESCGCHALDLAADGRTALVIATYENHLTSIIYLASLLTSEHVNQLGAALLAACSCGHADAARVLWRRGAHRAHFDRLRPIHVAADFGHATIVHDLISWGEDPRAKTDSGDTARDLAARKGHGPVVALLDVLDSVR